MESPKKILIVEDESIVAKDLEQSLEKLGYTVCGTTGYGEEALEKARETGPDLVLMDIMLKGRMEGIQTASAMREIGNIPVVYLTAFADKMTLERVKSTHPFGYLLKPFEEKELETTVEIAFSRSRLEISQKKSYEVQKMESLERLAGGLAHDFNNLLMIMRGYSESLCEQLQEDTSKRSELEEIINAADRATRLTRQLLLFSRRHIVQPQFVYLNEMLDCMTETLQRLVGESYSIGFDLSSELDWIKVDPLFMEQIVTDLALNARDAMPAGGVIKIETRNVTVDEKSVRGGSQNFLPGRYVMFSITDKGQGMDEKTLAHVFEPFFTTKDPGKGLGLGLSTVYGIIRQSHGYISIVSQLGQGSTVKIYLPAFPVPRDEKTLYHPPSGRVRDLQFRDFKKANVLLVENESAVRGLAARFLQERGFGVLQASNGVEALAILKKNPNEKINLLITDVNMPHMGGKELETRLRQSHPEMKVLFISGYTDDKSVCQDVEDGKAAYLQKPFHQNDFLTKVNQILTANDHSKGKEN